MALACTPPNSDRLKENEAASSRAITRLLVSRGKPDTDSEQIYQTYRLSELGLERSQIGRLLDDLVPKLTSSKNDRDRKRFRDNLRGILYALGAAGYAFEWLVLPHQDKHYRSSERLGQLGLSRRRVERIIDLLVAEKLVVKGRGGFRHPVRGRQSKASQYFPTPKLMEYFAGCLYEFEADFDVPLYRFNDFDPKDIPSAESIASEVARLQRYNDHMQQFSWAKKGPTCRIYSKTMERGGRLFTPFQSIAKNRIPIRPATLLDGCPIVEPDFSANHLRMIAALHQQVLPEDPYASIADEAGVSREAVKAFTTAALGATSRRQTGGVMRSLRANDRSPVTTGEFRRIRAAFDRHYPWIRENNIFFNDVGARMQVLEGAIAMRVLDAAVDAGVPVLAVHDAFAVRVQDASLVVEMMRIAWMAELRTSIEPVIRLPDTQPVERWKLVA